MKNEISDISDFWQHLDHVALGLTRSTFDAQVRGVTALGIEAGTVILQATGPHNLEWLEARLKGNIERGLSAAAGRTLQVRFVLPQPAVEPPAAMPAPPPEPTPGPLAQVNHALAGYNQYTHYLMRFWRPYIGAAPFDVWQFVRSFCKDGSLAWTPGRDFTGIELARGADCGVQRITGVWRGCPVFDQAFLEDGEVLPRCCGQYEHIEPGEWPQMTKATDRHPNGRPTCRHWVYGALEILEAEGLLVHLKQGDTPRNTFYTIQVYQHLPILTPRQTGRFTNKMRIEHRRFLHGLLRAHREQGNGWQYSLEAWQKETTYSALVAIDRAELLAGLTLPLPDDGVLRAAARNTIFFALKPCANERKRTE